MATYTQYLTALRSESATRVLKIEQLDDNENIIDEISNRVVSGDIQKTDELGARRTANITFENSDGDFIPDADGDIWMNKKFKISTGIICADGESYYISQGIFLVTEPEVISELSNKLVSIQFLDKFSLLNGQLGGTLANTYEIEVGTSITDAVTAILNEVGDVKPPIIAPTTEVTPYTISKIVTDKSNYGEILIELANMLSWTVYYDENGYLRFEPKTDIDTAGSVWDYSTDEITLLGSRHRYEFTKVFNYIRVIGDNVNGATYTAYAEDTNATSETSISKIGKKVNVIHDELISSTALAQERADAELQASISIAESVDADSMCVDHINGGDIVTITDDSSGMDETRFLVKNITVPLINQSNMTLSVWKGRSLS